MQVSIGSAHSFNAVDQPNGSETPTMSSLNSAVSTKSQLSKLPKVKTLRFQLEQKSASREQPKEEEPAELPVETINAQEETEEKSVAPSEKKQTPPEQTAEPSSEPKKVRSVKHFGAEKPGRFGLFVKLAGNFAGHLDNCNALNIECPDILIVRMFDVICSWQKFTKELTHFTRMGLFNYLKRNWFEPYLMQLIDDLRVQSSNDNRFYHDSPIVHSWSHSPIQVQQTAFQYVCWKLTTDGGYDVGRHTLPHNQIQKLYWYHLLKSNKLQVHLYPDVKNTLENMKRKSKFVCFTCDMYRQF